MKIYNYVIMGVVLMSMLMIFGIETGSSNFLSKFGIDAMENLKAGAIWTKLASIFALGIASSLIIGKFTSASPTYAIKAFFIMGVFGTLVWDFVYLLIKLNESAGWAYWIFFIILAPLIAGYAVALLEFWEGRD